MYWSDEVVLLESCCSLLNYHHEQIKRKKKRTCVREIFLKNDRTKSLPKFIAGDTCQWKSTTLQVIYVMNFLAKVVKKNVWPFRVWVGPLLFIKVLLNCSNVPQAFFSRSLSFVSFISLFVKARILLQFLRPAFIILYVLLIFSRFHKCYDNFHWSKNLPTSKFFHWNMCFLIFLLPWRKGGGRFSLKQNNFMRLKTKRFLIILTDNHTEIWEIIFSAIKIWAFTPARLEIILCKSEWE